MIADILKRYGVPPVLLDKAVQEVTHENERHVQLEASRVAALVVQKIIEQAPEVRRAVIHDKLGALRIQAAARLAGCSVKTLRRACARGEITTTRNATGRVFLDRESFRHWRESRIEGQNVDNGDKNGDTRPAVH